MNLKEIKDMPTTNKNIHESIFRSYHILNNVKEMLERGDNSRTILDIIEFIEEKATKEKYMSTINV